MSRARKIKKANRWYEFELADKDGGLRVVAWGFSDERQMRLDRMHEKRTIGMGVGWLKPAPMKHRR